MKLRRPIVRSKKTEKREKVREDESEDDEDDELPCVIRGEGKGDCI